MSTDAIDIPTTTMAKRQMPTRRERRAFYAILRSKARHTDPSPLSWAQTRLCVPNPRPGRVVDHIGSDGNPVMRSCIFGGNVDGVPLQRAQAKHGNRYR